MLHVLERNKRRGIIEGLRWQMFHRSIAMWRQIPIETIIEKGTSRMNDHFSSPRWHHMGDISVGRSYWKTFWPQSVHKEIICFNQSNMFGADYIRMIKWPWQAQQDIHAPNIWIRQHCTVFLSDITCYLRVWDLSVYLNTMKIERSIR